MLDGIALQVLSPLTMVEHRAFILHAFCVLHLLDVQRLDLEVERRLTQDRRAHLDTRRDFFVSWLPVRPSFGTLAERRPNWSSLHPHFRLHWLTHMFFKVAAFGARLE